MTTIHFYLGSGQNTTLQAMAMSRGDNLIGGITWHKPGMDDPRRIDAIWVHPNYRRQGLASRMKAEAERQVGYRLRHSIIRSAEGDAWAKSVGGAGANDHRTLVVNNPISDQDYQHFIEHLHTLLPQQKQA